MIISILFLFSVVFPTILVGMENRTITLLQENMPAIEQKIESTRTEFANEIEKLEEPITPYPKVSEQLDKTTDNFFSHLKEYLDKKNDYLNYYNTISSSILNQLHNVNDSSKNDELLENDTQTRKLISDESVRFRLVRQLFHFKKRRIEEGLVMIDSKNVALSDGRLEILIKKFDQHYKKLLTTQLRLCTLSTALIGQVPLDTDSIFIDTHINISMLLHPGTNIDTFLATQSIQSLKEYKLYLQEKMRTFIQENTQLKTLQQQANEALEHFDLFNATAASYTVITNFFQSARLSLSHEEENDLLAIHETIIKTCKQTVLQTKEFIQILLESINTGDITRVIQAYKSLQEMQKLAQSSKKNLIDQLDTLKISIDIYDLYIALWNPINSPEKDAGIEDNIIKSLEEAKLYIGIEQKQQITDLHTKIVNGIKIWKLIRKQEDEEKAKSLMREMKKLFDTHNQIIKTTIDSLKESYDRITIDLRGIDKDLTTCAQSEITTKLYAVERIISPTTKMHTVEPTISTELSTEEQTISAQIQEQKRKAISAKKRRRNKILMGVLGLGLLSSAAIGIYYWLKRPSK